VTTVDQEKKKKKLRSRFKFGAVLHSPGDVLRALFIIAVHHLVVDMHSISVFLPYVGQ
jgi:hypothetical protein